MKIIITEDIVEKYKGLTKDFESIFDYGLALSSLDYAEFIKENYLLGQKMDKKTGELFDSVKFIKNKNFKSQSYVVLAGVGISGHLNYLNRYIGTQHEFMSPSFKRWQSENRAIKIIEDNFEKVAHNKGII